MSFFSGDFPYQPGDYKAVIKYDSKLFSRKAKQFISKLLLVNPEQRLGHQSQGGVQTIKRHSFFKDICWNDVYFRRMNPPFVPDLNTSGVDLKYFDKEFVSIPAEISISEEVEDRTGFEDFEYINPDHRKVQRGQGSN